MIVVCSYCGAPLDVPEGVAITKCAYCGRSDERKNLRTLHEQTPREFVPPRRWRPPDNVPAASTEEYEYNRPSKWIAAGMVFAIVGGILVVAIVLFVALARRPTPPISMGPPVTTDAPPRVDPGVFDGASIDGTIEELYQRLGGDTNGAASLTLYVGHDAWNKVAYGWPTLGASHPASVSFYRTGAMSADDAERISHALGIRLSFGDTWKWGGVSIDLQPNLLYCTVLNSKGLPIDPHWKREIDVAYSVLKEVVYGQESPIGIDERREILGATRPFAELDRLDTTTSIEDAPTAVRKDLPGVLVTQKSNQLDILVSVDHARFAYARLIWRNTRGAKLETVVLEPIKAPRKSDAGTGSRLDELSECLAKALGKPTTTDVDYLKGTKRYAYMVAGAHVALTDGGLFLTTTGPAKGIAPAVWKKFVTTLDGCQ
jgi:hypothetical protein